jgi:hypothetical protein
VEWRFSEAYGLFGISVRVKRQKVTSSSLPLAHWAASNMPLSGEILHVCRSVHLKEESLLRKKSRKCKNVPKLLGIPTVSIRQSSPFSEIARVLVRHRASRNHFVIAGEQRSQNSLHEVLRNHRGQSRQRRFQLGLCCNCGLRRVVNLGCERRSR